MPFSRVTAHLKGKKNKKKDDFHIWIWLVKLRRIRENSRNRRGCHHSLHSYRIRGPLLTRRVTSSMIILSTLSHWVPTMSQAPMSQTVKEEMILGTLNLSDWKEKKKDWHLTFRIQLRIGNALRHFLLHALSTSQFIQNHCNTDSSQTLIL